jgi:GNAT superfamily N-acetyltransferase
MNYVYTNGKSKDFIMLSQMLDENLNEIVGGEKQRKEYAQYNLLDNIHDVILIYDNETPIACAAFKYYEDGVAEVKRVFLHKNYRGQGLAKDLLNQLESRAKSKGFQKLILETGKLLIEAMGLYSKLGYRIIDNYGQYKDMKDSICMSKEISKEI